MTGAELDRCPNCWMRLVSRHVEPVQAAVFECRSCGGYWIPWEILHELAERTRSSRPMFWDAPSVSPAGDGERRDRGCPVCEVVMDRQSCGRIVLDVCREHGVWFDPSELEVFLSWVQEEKLQGIPGASAGPNTVVGSVLAATPPLSREWKAPPILGVLDPVSWLIECLAGGFKVLR